MLLWIDERKYSVFLSSGVYFPSPVKKEISINFEQIASYSTFL